MKRQCPCPPADPGAGSPGRSSPARMTVLAWNILGAFILVGCSAKSEGGDGCADPHPTR